MRHGVYRLLDGYINCKMNSEDSYVIAYRQATTEIGSNCNLQVLPNSIIRWSRKFL